MERHTTDMNTDDSTLDGSTDRPAADDGTLSNPEPITGEHPGGTRREQAPFPAIASEVREHLDGDASGHDMAHVWRVFRLGTRFADELGADVEVVGAAALTHDVHRVRGDGTGVDPAETTDEVGRILDAAGVPEAKVSAVRHAVAVHDEYAFRGEDPAPDTLEAEILRDADNLDAMGAVGVGRTFMFGGAHGTPMWDPDGGEYSQIYHFEDKLLRLRDEMHTEPARELAAERHEFLREFVGRFRAEWHGER
ncbi:MAG: HD domain-containing protein [Halobacteriales archaeon]